MRALGVDVGERRVGLALSDPSGTLATPLTTLSSFQSLEASVAAVAGEIDRLAAQDDGLGAVVVGLPKGLDGHPHDETSRVLAFADALRQHTAVPIAFQDERLSSREAESRLALRQKDWRRRKLRLDAAAAAVILQDYLDRGAEKSEGRSQKAEDHEVASDNASDGVRDL